MKKNLFLLCILSGLICATGINAEANENSAKGNNVYAKINNVNPSNLKLNGYYTTNSDIQFNISVLGKGIDLVKGNVSKTDTNTVKSGSYIFDQNWLVSKYDEAVENCLIEIGRVEHVYSNGLTLQEITESFKTKFSNNLSIDASYAAYSAGLSTSFNSTNVTTNRMCESHMYVQDRICYDAFKIDMPEMISNKRLYSEHLSEGFTYAIEDVQNGEIEWIDIFDMFGTHVLSSATYGGYSNLNYDAYSNKTTFDQEESTNFSMKIEASGSYEGVDADFRDELVSDVAQSHHISSLDVFVSITQEMVGGPINYCVPAFDPDDINFATNRWLEHINEDVKITKFSEAAPIWEFLPRDIPNRNVLIQNAKAAYHEYKKEGEYILPSNLNMPFTRTATLIKENEEVLSECGALKAFSWSPFIRNINSTKEKNLPSISALKKYNYDQLNIVVSGKVKDGYAFASKKRLFIEFYSADGTLLKTIENDKNIGDNITMSSYNSFECEFDLCLDESDDSNNIDLYNSTLRVTLCTFETFAPFVGGKIWLNDVKIDFNFSSSLYND